MNLGDTAAELYGPVLDRLDPPETVYGWLRDLFPIPRSLTGPGVRDTLAYLRRLLPDLTIHEVPSGTRVFDWTVPPEWRISEAWLAEPSGRKVVDFRDRALHVVGYSEAIDREVGWEELQAHLHSVPDQPDAVPYVTAYYRRTWGFCMTETARRALRPGPYRAVIRSEHLDEGSLTYADLVIPGDTADEVMFSSYVCHPDMANNELSGPVVVTALARAIAALPRRRYTYRFVLGPETIGALVYLSRNLKHLRARLAAGFVVTCAGDERAYTLLSSRRGDTLADRVGRLVLAEHTDGAVSVRPFTECGSDERQYCYPTVDLPVSSVMRSMYDTFPEYHTSLDDLSLVSAAGLRGTLEGLAKIVSVLEANGIYRATTIGEPQLGPRGLYPTVSTLDSPAMVRDLLNVLFYSDGDHDTLDIAERIGVPAHRCAALTRRLADAGVIAPLSSADGST